MNSSGNIQHNSHAPLRRMQRTNLRLTKLEARLPRLLEKARKRALRRQARGDDAEGHVLLPPLLMIGLWRRRAAMEDPIVTGNVYTRWFEDRLYQASAAHHDWIYTPTRGRELFGFTFYDGIFASKRVRLRS